MAQPLSTTIRIASARLEQLRLDGPSARICAWRRQEFSTQFVDVEAGQLLLRPRPRSQWQKTY
ncbi:MAG: hypothetical protein ACLP1E_04930 [Acidimicrobiales bacterium]